MITGKIHTYIVLKSVIFSRNVASLQNNSNTLATAGCNLWFLSGHFHALLGEIKGSLATYCRETAAKWIQNAI